MPSVFAKEVEVAANPKKARLGVLEAELQSCIGRQGQILKEIRDGELYREAGYDSFTDYCQREIGTSYRDAWRDIVAFEVMAAIPDVEVPAHALALAAVPEERRQEVWDRAKQDSGGKPRTKDIERAAAPPSPADKIDEMRGKGVIGKDAEAFVTYLGDPQDDEPDDEPEPEETDEEWLAKIEARKDLPEHIRDRFDADAILFREASPHRLDFAGKFSPLARKAKKATRGHIGAWQGRVTRLLHGNDPTRWKACGKCGGAGVLSLIGRCPDCRGEGYTI